MPGHNGGFNPYRDGNGEFTEVGNVGGKGRSREGGPLKWVAKTDMNTRIRSATGRGATAPDEAPAFGADRPTPTYKPSGYPVVTEGDYQAMRSNDYKVLEIWEGHQFRGFADPGQVKEAPALARAAIAKLRDGVTAGADARKADARAENARRAGAGQEPVFRELTDGDVAGFVREQGGWFSKLPATTKQQMVAFQDTGALNGQIRSGRITNRKQYDALLGAMKPNDEAFVSYRGVDGRYLPALKPGATFKVKEFSSTSLTPGTAVSYARDGEKPVVMKIRVPTGQPMVPMLRDGRGVELAMEEVLLPPGMTYKVVRVGAGSRGTTLVEVEIVTAEAQER